ncbi:MAG: hypothetical protein SFV55_15760 [Haliscomenobacter sp.]|uniref:hypothetical protein n=1 Tax=Haliscomenobacter sp. TaxID=2717303 RepID=UPI0029BCA500|nr:hypothetical protein [Haliscomenobacter sp.]MDX2069885.1 hypothetical protein [Haliscomenobacter sp.]
MTIYTPGPSKIILKKDTLHTEANEAHFLVPRSKEALSLRVIADSSDQSLTVNAKNSFAYYLNLAYNFGLGMLVDQNNRKRYTYPRRIYLDSTAISGLRYQPSLGTQKGEVNVHLTMPFLNSFVQKPTQDGSKVGIGLLGLGFGLDYYHQNDQYLKLGFCTVSDFFSPFPAPVYVEGGRDYLNSAFGYLSNHHRIKRLDWGYGIILAENKWTVDNYIDQPDSNPPQISQRKRSVSAGLIFSGHYFTGPSFHMGLQYCPSLWRLYENPGFRYEHVIGVDLAWKIRL